MEYGVYLESSIVDLKPTVLDFLTKIVDKAKEVRDFAISIKKKELAEIAGKDTRTVSRYLNELEERHIIETKGVRGRSGGTVILFNTELIRFDTSDKALVNSDSSISIDDVVQKKLPKKGKEPKKKTRNRRTKKQMMEDQLLQNQQQAELDELNAEVASLGGVPNWEWFQKTDDPVGNYKTYLLSRLYNRYAALFTDRHNAEVVVSGEGNQVPKVSSDYDVLPENFFGSSRWQQFEKFRQFCEENNIEPDVYLSAQFSRSVFTAAARNAKNKVLPYVNTLTTDTSYEVYKQYCDYQTKGSWTYAMYKQIPIQFADDFIIRAITEAYGTAECGLGLLSYRHAINDFLEGFGADEREEVLVEFYRITEENLHNQKVSFKTRDTIKKFVLTQSMILSGGISRLPGHLILGAEHTQVVLASIDKLAKPIEERNELKAMALGMLTHPQIKPDKQLEKGRMYLYQSNVLYETPQVLSLIMERKNLKLSLEDINKALKEYGKEKVPVDDYSVLDVDQIVNFVLQEEYIATPKEFQHEEITDTQSDEWVLIETKAEEADFLEQAAKGILGSDQLT